MTEGFAYAFMIVALLILVPLFAVAGLLAGAALAVYLEVAQ